jgi:hypothetical protein
MKTTETQNKVYSTLMSFYDFKQEHYLEHGDRINEILTGKNLLEAPEEGIPSTEECKDLLSDITSHMTDGFKAPESKIQLIYELFWG